MGCGREATLSPEPESGSSGVGRHVLDGIFGDATSGRMGPGILIGGSSILSK